MTAISSRPNCPIEMSFDLDEALTLPQDIPSRRSSAVSNSSAVVSMSTAVAPVNACSVCMEGFEPGEGGKQVPCGHVYHEACISEWFVHHNSCPNCRYKIFQEN
ncbi:E3 ubiquitin-protein ligase RING1-like protein [Morus notabilis]|uniref:E3 ubiquitin-protein ligase RING1-like protein n=1 Tax=Morus notabilis TaxID=981085 RepID=W9RM01_9ROSA|nr:E3 ubiquitin-protein ligase RING1-like protein [Morus notabilis]